MTAPYQRIADDLRARILAGELRPGDLVPSARGIARDRGVALATATRALAVLRQEGLTSPVPGIGTVVADRAAPPARRRPAREPDGELDRARIVAAAIAIADADGLAEVSMRRIATDLGVATMSLYRHVGGKDELVLHMADAAFGGQPLPADPPPGWRDALELSSRLLWALFRRHPWLAPGMSITRPQFAPNGIRHTDWVLRALDGLGLSGAERINTHLMLLSYVRGLAMNLEAEARAEQDTGMTSDEWMATHEEQLMALAAAPEFATFLRFAATTEFELDLDALFEFGLARFLDGLAARLGPTP
ncbi:TetR/AcrR family transcriptional regulator C-terminal domain-containing protein [Longispora sp. K20-0274]|uniref:TetR/AcrR family transcriptional regulator C-terminal domain-containing protein n=1 Tax=Longispora sp. K20-0274 TaxID=3088255 RepID=UPI00399A4D78